MNELRKGTQIVATPAAIIATFDTSSGSTDGRSAITLKQGNTLTLPEMDLIPSRATLIHAMRREIVSN